MLAVGVRRSDHDLAVARELDFRHDVSLIRNSDAAHFGRVLRYHRHFRPGLNAMLAAMECHTIGGQIRTVPFRGRARRLMRRRPDVGAAYVLHVTELAGGIGGAVGAPPGDREILVPAVAAPAVADHDGVRKAPKQRDVGLRRVGAVDLADDRTLEGRIGQHRLAACRPRFLERQTARNPLVQQQLRRPHERVGVEPSLPDPIVQCIRQRDERHADMMRHVVANDGVALSGRWTRVVERIIEAILAERALRLEHGKIGEGALRLDRQRERSGVGCDNEILANATLESEIGNTEGTVLIGEMAIAEIVGALARPPRYAVIGTERDLPLDGATIRLVQERQRV